MIANSMAAGSYPGYDLWEGCRILADDEESCVDFVIAQRSHDTISLLFVRSIVKGQEYRFPIGGAAT